ncbi:MAG: tetratricopeptide repeat protein [Melioribacteraceae bacterium]
MIYRVKIFFTILFLITSILYPQIKSDGLKRQAQFLMKEGRYGEAIDQLNKFISANPQLAEGYHLRGLCYEKTIQYQYAVLDLRRAERLDPKNEQIKVDLNRVISVWHQQLYQKIEGHKRDIAIDPNYPFNYLEIGKAYRWLEEWDNAELWYDEYLKRDDNASPDEIIRYTEILAKTGSITKGERILKKYVERYPDDWRLWSRYGYFTLWLGKYKIAENAFQKALDIKPFFKEAQDGLDIARNQAYLLQYQPRSFEYVYPIDRYYRELKRNPNDDKIRFALIKELISANRYEEAFQQLQYLQNKYADDEEFKSLYQKVTAYRDSTYNSNIELYTGMLKENPNNKEAVIKLAQTYANLLYYDNAIEVLTEYLKDKSENEDLDVRFLYAKYCAWNYEWEKAIAQINKLLELDPENLDYQLLRAQIAVWTVLDLDLAEKYLLNVIKNRPKELPAYLSLVSLYAWKKNFPEAKKYLDIAKEIDPSNPEVVSAESNYELHLSAYEETKVFEIRAEAEKLFMEGNCSDARTKYEEYFSKRTGPSRDELIEYANILTCAEDYPKTIEIYDKLLSDEFDFKIALQRANAYFLNKDSLKAVEELEKLSRIDSIDINSKMDLANAFSIVGLPGKADSIYQSLKDSLKTSEELSLLNEKLITLGSSYIKTKELDRAEKIFDELLKKINDEAMIKKINQQRLYLADAYALQNRWGKAEDIYDDLLDVTKDTSDIKIIKQRLSWIPPYGFKKGIYVIKNIIIPTNIGLSPFSNFYGDNQSFRLWSYGLNMDGGFIGFLSLGGSYQNVRINNKIVTKDFHALKGILSLYIIKNLSASLSYGILNILGEKNKNIGTAVVKYEKQDELLLSGYYENNDARLILYSPYLMNTRLKAEIYRVNGSYLHNNQLQFIINYSYYNVSDKNEGNDLLLRVGRKFFENGIIGYEYYFADFAYVSSLYYSPQNFISHSLWGEYKWLHKSGLKLNLFGKIGYVPAIDFFVSEYFIDASYNPLKTLSVNGRVGFSNSYRFDSVYQSFSTSFSLYWNIF